MNVITRIMTELKEFILKSEVIKIIGLLISVYVFLLTQSYQNERDFYHIILKEQMESDSKLLELVGELISQEDRFSKKSMELKRKFTALFYGKTILLNGCFNNKEKDDALFSVFSAINTFYDKNKKGQPEATFFNLSSLTIKVRNLSDSFGNSYIQKNNKCVNYTMIKPDNFFINFWYSITKWNSNEQNN